MKEETIFIRYPKCPRCGSKWTETPYDIEVHAICPKNECVFICYGYSAPLTMHLHFGNDLIQWFEFKKNYNVVCIFIKVT